MHRLLTLEAMVPWLVHGFSTKIHGNQGFGLGCPAWEIITNRAEVLRKVYPFRNDFPFRFTVGMTPRQTGCEEEIAIVGPQHAGLGIGPGMDPETIFPCEAMITDSPDFLLFLAPGDCIPIIVASCDPRHPAIGLVHAGRESTVRNIPVKTVNRISENFGVRLQDIIVGMGPGIRSYHLQYFAPYKGSDPLWRECCRETEDGLSIDLFGYNRLSLMRAGVPPENIEECYFDTFTDPEFFSHCRSAKTGEPEGRHAAVVGMMPTD